MIRTSPSTEQPEAVQQSPVISILLADVSCQHHYLSTALDAAVRERCRRNPRLHERADWRTSRFLKQQAAAELASGTRWSMSHSAGHAALAIGWEVDALGVDLEHARPRPFADLLPAFARPEEEAWWQQSPDPCQAFYRLWTLKEALFKAQSADAEPKGLMALGLRRPVATGQAWRLQGPDERDWRGISAMLSPDRMLACVWVSSVERAPFPTDSVLDETSHTSPTVGTTLRWVRHGNWPPEASGVMHFSSHPDA